MLYSDTFLMTHGVFSDKLGPLCNESLQMCQTVSRYKYHEEIDGFYFHAALCIATPGETAATRFCVTMHCQRKSHKGKWIESKSQENQDKCYTDWTD